MSVWHNKVLVLGAGAIGGYFGARLLESGAEVTFLVRPRRREQLQRDGLVLSSPLGDARLAVNTIDAATVAGGYDLVLLTCKAYDLDSAIDAVRPAMGAGATLLPLLNGLSHLERLDAAFGAEHVLGGSCMVDVSLKPDGTILHNGPLQRILFGERDRRRTERLAAIEAMFARSIVHWETPPDIMLAMWDKLVFLSALAATCCLFRANVGEINAAPGGREAVERTLVANIEIATRSGYPPTEAAMTRARERLTDANANWSASLLRDLESGGQVEGDHIVGWMLGRARQCGVDDTMLSLAFTALKAYEVRRDAGRLGTGTTQ